MREPFINFATEAGRPIRLTDAPSSPAYNPVRPRLLQRVQTYAFVRETSDHQLHFSESTTVTNWNET